MAGLRGYVQCHKYKHTHNTRTHTHTNKNKCQEMCVVCFLPICSGRQVRWMYQPGSHRRKITPDFSSTFLLRRMPLFFLREGFSRFFPSSTVKSKLSTNDLIVLHSLGIFIFYFFIFLVSKNPTCRDSNSCPNVSEGYEVTN